MRKVILFLISIIFIASMACNIYLLKKNKELEEIVKIDHEEYKRITGKIVAYSQSASGFTYMHIRDIYYTSTLNNPASHEYKLLIDENTRICDDYYESILKNKIVGLYVDTACKYYEKWDNQKIGGYNKALCTQIENCGYNEDFFVDDFPYPCDLGAKMY
ncbi:MAG: hypothetical protein IJD03_05675 [Clostridia bacterium]|nr:hypothetical protein [Clostridia bacterium]